jgi:hypothetical protein
MARITANLHSSIHDGDGFRVRVRVKKSAVVHTAVNAELGDGESHC